VVATMIGASTRPGPTVIAEIGVNHDGRVDRAIALVDVAVRAGADIAKFQHFTAQTLASPHTPFTNYQAQRVLRGPSHFEMLRALELSDEEFRQIASYCDEVGIEFMSTPYSIRDVGRLMDLGVRRFKTASADIVDEPLHDAIIQTGLPCVASTGMASLREIQELVDHYAQAAHPLTLLHTTSAYPTALENVNLVRIPALRQRFGIDVGFSDHSQGDVAAIGAVALGAVMLEKHITLDSRAEGPDHFCSCEPDDFVAYVARARAASAALGNDSFTRTAEEENMAATSRKSLHWASSLPAGHVITPDDLRLMRPGTGMPWKQQAKLIGQRTTEAVASGGLVSPGEVDALVPADPDPDPELELELD